MVQVWTRTTIKEPGPKSERGVETSARAPRSSAVEEEALEPRDPSPPGRYLDSTRAPPAAMELEDLVPCRHGR